MLVYCHSEVYAVQHQARRNLSSEVRFPLAFMFHVSAGHIRDMSVRRTFG